MTDCLNRLRFTFIRLSRKVKSEMHQFKNAVKACYILCKKPKKWLQKKDSQSMHYVTVNKLYVLKVVTKCSKIAELVLYNDPETAS